MFGGVAAGLDDVGWATAIEGNFVRRAATKIGEEGTGEGMVNRRDG